MLIARNMDKILKDFEKEKKRERERENKGEIFSHAHIQRHGSS